MSLEAALRQALLEASRAGQPVSYLTLADRLLPGERHRIHRLTLQLEDMARQDVAAGRPLLALLAVGKLGLPGRGFLELTSGLGLHDGSDPAAWYRRALAEAIAYWGAG